MKTLIGYIRVSTDEQGTSGNGLEAQKAAIIKFAEDAGYILLDIVQEVASGKLGLNERPVLKAAISKALKMKAVLIVSKLDRLSREAAFILNMMNTKAKFLVAQFGEGADEFMIHMYAVLGEKERKMIGERTKSALAILKAKGVTLGGPKVLEASVLGGEAVSVKADGFAIRIRPTVERMMTSGMSMRAIARELNENGTKTARGGLWTAQSINNLVVRFSNMVGV